jgi:hypothetical protein
LGICRGRERQSQKHCEQNQAHFPHNLLLVPPRPGVPNAGTGAELRFQHLPVSGILYPTGFWLLEQQFVNIVAVSFHRIVQARRKGKPFLRVCLRVCQGSIPPGKANGAKRWLNLGQRAQKSGLSGLGEAARLQA